MSRYQASLYHLLISAVVFFVIAYFVLFVWYPDFFFAIDGGWEGMRIIIGVDLVLGPVLTLVVFKSGKPGLKLDLALIGIFQSVCLSFGTWVVYTERPTFFIYYEKHFYSSNQDTFSNYGLQPADPADFSQTTPAMVYVSMPDNPIEEADLRQQLYTDQIPPWISSDLYHSLSEHLDTIINESAMESDMRERDLFGNLNIWLTRNGGEFSDYAFLPIHSRYRDAYLGIRKSDEQFIGIVEIPPPLSTVE